MKPSARSCLLNVVFESPSTLTATLLYDGQTIAKDTLALYGVHRGETYFFPWLVDFMKPIYDHPLSTNLDVKLVGDKTLSDPVLPVIQAAVDILQGTRKALSKHQAARRDADSRDGLLFLNLGETLFIRKLYETALRDNPKRVHYDPCHFLNAVSKDVSPCASVDGLMEAMRQKNIGRVFTHNVTLLNHYLHNHRIHLPSFLRKIDVELTIVDVDTYDQREGDYYQKKMFHENGFRRFCIMPHIEKYWDGKLGLKNIRYTPLPYEIQDECPMTLPPDYSILVTSWARLKHVLYFFKPILLFIEYLDRENPFFDFQFFFHSLAYLLKNDEKIPLAVKMRYLTLISEMFYHTNALMKFETLQGIRTERRIDLYGESDWKALFPEYYRGQADQNDLNRRLDETPYVTLLMNQNYHYLENNPMFVRMLNANKPYLGFCSVLKTEDLEGLSTLEFSGIETLNAKIDRVDALIRNDDWRASRKSLKDILNPCVRDFHHELTSSPSLGTGTDAFEKLTDSYHFLFQEKLTASLPKQLPRLKECLERTLKEDFRHLKPEDSAWMDRPYFRKIADLYRQTL